MEPNEIGKQYLKVRKIGLNVTTFPGSANVGNQRVAFCSANTTTHVGHIFRKDNGCSLMDDGHNGPGAV